MKPIVSILKSVILAAAGLSAVSCMRGADVTEPRKPTSDGVNIHFRVSMSRPGGASTRAADDAEFAVNNISLLVFEQVGGTGDFTYRYKAMGRRIDQPNSTAVDFEALLTDSEYPVRLLAVANRNDGSLDAIEAGSTEAEVRGTLVGTDSDFSQGLPMTGVAELNSISDATGVVKIPLVRSVAKVSVVLLPNGGSPDFTISGVEVWRNPVRWQLFPGALCIEKETSAPLPITPSLPFSEDVVNRQLNAADGLHSGYVFESAIPPGAGGSDSPAAKATCVVVRGRYADAEADTYYRINFGRLGDEANPLGQVLRNYWYEFTIVGVEGPGWESAESAAANPASGLRVSATPWNGGGNTDFYFGDNDYIKLSADSVVLAAQTGRTATMTITTSGVPFSLSSVHYPGAGRLDISDSGGVLTTDKMSFDMALLSDGQDEHRWQLTVTALTDESITDYLLLRAADGLITINIFIQRDPPPDQPPPVPNDPTKRKIRVLSLGAETFGSMNRQTAYGVPAMLRNTNYFGPTGTVPCAAIEILPTVTTVSDAEAVRTALAGADIIVTTWAYYPGTDVTHAIWEWITEKGTDSGRVAFLTSDNDAVIHDLRELLDGQMYWRMVGVIGNDPSSDFGYGTGYTGFVPMAAADNDPFLDGVFGDARNCGTSRVTYDGTSQYINIAGANPAIVPLIVATGTSGPNNNVVLMGVDTARHIVYLGEARLMHSEGMGTTNNSALAYDSNNYANAIWSNTWAWAINRVMTENYNVEEALVE